MTAQLERVDEAGMELEWTPVCRVTDLLAERGVAALVSGPAGPHQVAVFRTFEGMLYALDNRDPFSGAYVMSRGIVGTRADCPTVASPVLKQVFDLRSGECLSESGPAIGTHDVRELDGVVEIRLRGL
jgi:nitrite reductase (NADH) small subunit